MGIFTTTDANELYDEVIEKLQSDVGETLYPGDERRIFGESLCGLWVILYNTIDNVAKQTFLRWARNEILDAIGDMFYQTYRLQAEPAKTTLRYSINDYFDRDITISAGTRAETGDGKCFATDIDAVIRIGELSVDIPATAIEGGSDYNGYLSGSIVTMTDLVSFVDAVTNLTTTSDGTDVEKDDAYRERIRLAMDRPSNAASRNGIIYFVKSADVLISDVCVTTPKENHIDVSFVLSNGNLPDENLISTVESIVLRDDVRAMNDVITVKSPDPIEYDINIKYYVAAENEASAVQAIEETSYVDETGAICTGAIEQYRLWQDSKIKRDINPDKLIKLILDAGADRVQIISPTYLEIKDHEVAHFSGNITIEHVKTLE